MFIDTKVNSIMPSIYAKHHDKFIENYVSNFEEKSLSNERMVMAKTKTNYVIPVYLNVKVLTISQFDSIFHVNFQSISPQL